MTPLICGVMNMFGTGGSVVWPVIVGPYMEHKPQILLYAALVCTVSCVVIFFLQTLMLRFKTKLITTTVDNSSTINTISSKVDC